ncbi:Nicotinate dehydrogenase medium molybdopterin subunit [Pelotomaculum sp. FP]|uniref:xanthine dehydrogenase family protein molybdopterin-binding subunit n=1 Tax=Pelotomaculum sp. FP TaxID=261474 RepID=UPI00106650FF|nr:molybdopterin cofactor-binding domain-containing protein [Pelotomaculum sp. FP]TEB13044.1 Nicotinate dehydrogenase medium molybdopterin subunit [Pelotomaculum sp. FP]
MIKKGRGLASVFYPTGFNGGGDAETVSMRVKRDGCIDITNTISDLGQGLKMVTIQIAAETLGIGLENFTHDNTNTDTCSYSIGAAGSRSTYTVGNATIDAGKKLIGLLKSYGAGMLHCDVSEVQYEKGKVFKESDPSQAVTLKDIGGDANPGGVPLIVAGGFRPPVAPYDPETGKGLPSRTVGWGATVADVEVDDETGIVKVENLYTCYDIGTVINRLSAQGQVDGGDIMGIGMALFEDLTPNYPESIDMQTSNYTDYIIPTFMDMPKHSEVQFHESYDPYGPYGAKGLGEMVNNTQPAAIVNAIYDAVGVLVESIPATPEKILRLLEEKGK